MSSNNIEHIFKTLSITVGRAEELNKQVEDHKLALGRAGTRYEWERYLGLYKRAKAQRDQEIDGADTELETIPYARLREPRFRALLARLKKLQVAAEDNEEPQFNERASSVPAIAGTPVIKAGRLPQMTSPANVARQLAKYARRLYNAKTPEAIESLGRMIQAFKDVLAPVIPAELSRLSQKMNWAEGLRANEPERARGYIQQIEKDDKILKDAQAYINGAHDIWRPVGSSRAGPAAVPSPVPLLRRRETSSSSSASSASPATPARPVFSPGPQRSPILPVRTGPRIKVAFRRSLPVAPRSATPSTVEPSSVEQEEDSVGPMRRQRRRRLSSGSTQQPRASVARAPQGHRQRPLPRWIANAGSQQPQRSVAHGPRSRMTVDRCHKRGRTTLCTGVTRGGTPCKNCAVPGGVLCGIHARSAAIRGNRPPRSRRTQAPARSRAPQGRRSRPLPQWILNAGSQQPREQLRVPQGSQQPQRSGPRSRMTVDRCRKRGRTRLCIAMTRGGTPCKNCAQSQGWFCGIHARSAAIRARRVPRA